MNRKEQPDEQLVRMYRDSGDMTALGVLYERYATLTFGVCMKYLKDPVDSEDAAMGIFEHLTSKLRTQQVDAFRPWLYVVAKNHCLQILRARKRSLTEDLDGNLVHSGEEMHPFDETEGWQSAGLEECLSTLSDLQRRSIEAFYYQNKSYQEIAEILGCDMGTIRSYIQNGRRNLRNCMEAKQEAERTRENQ